MRRLKRGSTIVILTGLWFIAAGCLKKSEDKKSDRVDKEQTQQDRRKSQKEMERALHDTRRPLDSKRCELASNMARKHPGKAAFHHVVGRCHELGGRLDEAIKTYQKAWTLDNRSASIGKSLVQAYHRKGDTGRALELYKTRLFPRGPNRQLENLLTSPRITYFDPDRKVEAENRQDVLVRKAITDAQAGRFPTALRTLQASLAEDVNHLPTLVNLALVHARMEQWTKALQYLDRAWTILVKARRDGKAEPDVIAICLARAVVMHRRGFLRRARAEYVRLLKLAPDSELGLYGLGGVSSLLRDKNKALDTYNLLQKKNPRLAKVLFQVIMRND